MQGAYAMSGSELAIGNRNLLVEPIILTRCYCAVRSDVKSLAGVEVIVSSNNLNYTHPVGFAFT
jgi:hypothetical protein